MENNDRTYRQVACISDNYESVSRILQNVRPYNTNVTASQISLALWNIQLLISMKSTSPTVLLNHCFRLQLVSMALFPEFLWLGSEADHLSTPSFGVTSKWSQTSTPLYTMCTETAVPVSTCKVQTVTQIETARTHCSTSHKTVNHSFETRTPVEPSYITHIPPSLYQIFDTRSNNYDLRPSYTPTNTQNNLISHMLLWVVSARRTVVTNCMCTYKITTATGWQPNCS
jgi:hypothetical protein